MVLKVVLFYFLKQLTCNRREVFIVLNSFLLNILKKSVCVIKSLQGTGLMNLLASMRI